MLRHMYACRFIIHVSKQVNKIPRDPTQRRQRVKKTFRHCFQTTVISHVSYYTLHLWNVTSTQNMWQLNVVCVYSTLVFSVTEEQLSLTNCNGDDVRNTVVFTD